MSLRHLFSAAFAQEKLKLSYLGPVLNSTGSIETSPDSLILDQRKTPFRTLRCEFKFIPNGKADFMHNGNFDIAIVWSLSSSLDKKKLEKDLLTQNGCTEIIVLEDYKIFKELPDYTNESLKNIANIEKLKKLILRREFPSVFSLYIAASLYPETFKMDKMIELLCKRFPEVKQMRGKVEQMLYRLLNKQNLHL